MAKQERALGHLDYRILVSQVVKTKLEWPATAF